MDEEGCSLRGEELKIQQWRSGKVGPEYDWTYIIPLTYVSVGDMG